MCGEKQKLWVVLVRTEGQIMITSDLSQFSFRKLACIHGLISVRKLVRVELNCSMMELVDAVYIIIGAAVEVESMKT